MLVNTFVIWKKAIREVIILLKIVLLVCKNSPVNDFDEQPVQISITKHIDFDH